MDDDVSICKIYSLMLDRLGYESETVTSGEKVLERFAAARQAQTPFQAVILDLTVRDGMGGLATIKLLRPLAPDLYAVVASGSAREAMLSSFSAQGFNAVLPKPFRMQDLADCLQKSGAPPVP